MHERTILVLREDKREQQRREERERRDKGNKTEKDVGENKSGRTKEIEGRFLFYPDTFLPFTPATPWRGEAMPKIDLSRRIVPAENGYKLNEGRRK